MRRHRLAGLLGFPICLFPVVWVLAQDPATPADQARDEPLDVDLVERAERRLTQVDITLRPKKRTKAQPPELTVEDLEIVVTGKRRELMHVDRSCRALSGEREFAKETIEPPPLETESTMPAAAVVPSNYVFYLDHSHLTPAGQATAMGMARNMIRELIPNGNQGVVVSSGAKLKQSKLSGDTDYLLDFLDSINDDRGQWLSVGYADGEEERYTQILRYQEISPDSAKNLARTFLREERMYTRRELSRFSATLGGLADLDPPKAVVFFADIMRRYPGLHYARFAGIENELGVRNLADESHAFDRVTEEAAAHGVRLYTIQAEGLVTGMPGVIAERRGGFAATSATAVRRMPWERTNDAVRTLQAFALESGGRMFFGGVESATMKRVLNAIESDLSCFYLLSFDSEGMGEDGLLPVRVRFNQDSPRYEELEQAFEIQARGQIMILSERRKKEALLLAAHAASETVDSQAGHADVIPLGFEDGRFHGMAQFMVADPDLPEALVRETSWELGMTHVHREKVAHQTDRRVTIPDARIPVVLQAEWTFGPGKSELVLVGYEDRLGKLVTAHLDRDWPDPDNAEAVVTPVAVVQPEHAIFVDAEEKAKGTVEAPKNRVGSLAIGTGVAQVDRPIYFVSLVCRRKKDARVLWIDRTLVGNVPVEFTRQQWDRTGDERCVRIQDLIPENQVGWGDFEYRVQVYDDPALVAEPITTRTRKFTAVEPGMPTPTSDADGV